MPRPAPRPLSPARGRAILPIAERLRADSRFAGRGVTIAFLDSGFHAHPDLLSDPRPGAPGMLVPHDRIVAYHDALARRTSRRALLEPNPSAWHGLMTSVVAAGSGALSGGRYRGLAHAARLVLVKVGHLHRIVHDDIRKGLEWVIAHRDRYGIRVVNISCGGDYEASYLTDGLCRAADAAVRCGMVVVAAVGNAGNEARPRVLPPASAPSVLAVGGFDDGGAGTHTGGYHSSFGPTIDGLQKPEVVAPAIWVAAPILPGTPTAEQARLLARLQEAHDDKLDEILGAHAGIDPELDEARGRDPYLVRQLLSAKAAGTKVISGHYQHVDGTSFAAPIVSSVVAQMLEANPALSPQEVKRILLRTARRLPGIAPERQGFGVVRPSEAVAEALLLRG